jgi:shikimate kinase
VSIVYLVGFMGAGKSTVGRLVAQRLDTPFVDIDDRIEERAQATITEIFQADGEEVFRALESEELGRIAHGEPSVVACGGGIVLSDDNRRVMRETGCVAYLSVTHEEALARIGGAESRPLLASRGGEVAAELLAARRSLYESVADITIDTAGRSPDEVATRLVEGLDRCGRLADE